jgi:hypothetical protein
MFGFRHGLLRVLLVGLLWLPTENPASAGSKQVAHGRFLYLQ